MLKSWRESQILYEENHCETKTMKGDNKVNFGACE